MSEVEVHTNGDDADAPVRKHDVQAKTPVAGSGCPLQRTLRVKQRWQALFSMAERDVNGGQLAREYEGVRAHLPRANGGLAASSGVLLMGMASQASLAKAKGKGERGIVDGGGVRSGDERCWLAAVWRA